MSLLKDGIRSLWPRSARESVRWEQWVLEERKNELRRQRAMHAALLLRQEWETEELKRRLLAAQTRIYYLKQGEGRDWLPLRPDNSAAAAAELPPSETVTQREAPLPPKEAPVNAKPRAKMGELLIRDRIISVEQLEEAMAKQEETGGRLGDILIDLGYVSAEQLLPYISNQPNKGRLGDVLLQLGYLTKDQLEKALSFQRKSGGMLGDVLLSLQFLEPEQLYRAIANQNNIGRIGNEISFDPDMKLPEPIAREYGAVIIHQYENRLLVAVNEPLSDEIISVLEHRLEMPIEQVLATKNEMELFWSEVYGDEMLEESTSKLAIEQPHNSASTTFTKPQILSLALTVALFVGGLFWNFFATIVLVNVLVQIFYFFMTLFKFMIIMYGSRSGAQYRFTDEQIKSIDERDLPPYTILVPMYKESGVIPQLIRNLEKLDYPKAKLDVRLLIETDDIEAQELIQKMKLPSYYTVLVVPDSLPKTKPKACNFGLIRARGNIPSSMMRKTGRTLIS
ncbi:GspE/PulE/PilB domain-containing protein [Cohnella faecalis]|uniref:GspE/PulE/PilB domain-containing protein n=1 Tax=Cohnella faecalis TaxID=2315694 RepID=UPI002684A9CF|nr:hypothetical protein [Cohnella faecalis]